MNNDTIAPAFEAGLAALREAGISGTPMREAEALALSFLDAEWAASGLIAADLDDAGRQWWAGDAADALMGAYREGLREHARLFVERCMADRPAPEMEDLLEAAARAAELPPEDIVALVGEFCPIRHEGFALTYARVELRTWHAPDLVHYRFLKLHEARNGGYPPPWYRALLSESREFFADAREAA